VTDLEHVHLCQIRRCGTHSARTLKRAQILLLSATGDYTVAEIAPLLDVAPRFVLARASALHALTPRARRLPQPSDLPAQSFSGITQRGKTSPGLFYGFRCIW
jgi:hypothetical protein